MKGFAAIIMLAVFSTPLQAKTVLLKAELADVKELSEADRNKFYSSNAIGIIRFDSVFVLKMRPIKALIGDLNGEIINIQRASARPTVGGRYYILYEEKNNVKNIIWYGNVISGLCIDQGVASEHHIGKAVRRLRQSLPCKEPL